MIVLDTNVLSELMRQTPDELVVQWMDSQPISQFDTQIAAIARSRGAALSTRNTQDFGECGIQVIDPWLA